MFKWLETAFNPVDRFEILNRKIQELYSLLTIATYGQYVIIEFNDKLKDEKMAVRINGKMWTQTDNPMSELRELHTVLALNIKENREITITLE